MVSFLHGQNVGIGTAAPQNRLHVDGPTPTDANYGQLRISETTNSRYLLIGRAASYGFIQTHNFHPLSLNPLGNNVGIGIASPNSTARLHVDGGGTRGALLPSVTLNSATTWNPPISTGGSTPG